MKVSWPTDYVNVISGFGPRDLLGMTYHWGVDIEAPLDTPYYAVYDATITEIYWGGVVGWCIRYLSLDGKWLSEYHGCRADFPVSVGQQVSSGQVIAYSGDSESRSVSTGPHLHWTLIDQSTGGKIDPMAWYYSQTSETKISKEGEDMIEHGTPTKDGWFKAGWFTHAYETDKLTLDHCALVIVSGYDPPDRVDIYIEEADSSKRKFLDLGDWKRHQTKTLSNREIKGTGMIWLKPVDGELLDVTVRTVLAPK